jgi:serine acetyltransferase
MPAGSAREKPTVTPPTVWERPTLREFLDVVTDDWRTHDRDWRMPGFRAMVVHRFGTYRSTLRHAAVRRPLAPLVWALERRIRNKYGIELMSTATVGRNVRIAHQSAIVIHPRAVIGDRCVIRQSVTIGNGMAFQDQLHPVIGCDVLLGAGAVLIGDILVGDGVRVGPNAVVSTDVPNGAMVVAPKSRVFAS